LKSLEKRKENWSIGLKLVTTTTKMKVVKVRGEPKTIGIADQKHIRYTLSG